MYLEISHENLHKELWVQRQHSFMSLVYAWSVIAICPMPDYYVWEDFIVEEAENRISISNSKWINLRITYLASFASFLVAISNVDAQSGYLMLCVVYGWNVFLDIWAAGGAFKLWYISSKGKKKVAVKVWVSHIWGDFSERLMSPVIV